MGDGKVPAKAKKSEDLPESAFRSSPIAFRSDRSDGTGDMRTRPFREDTMTSVYTPRFFSLTFATFKTFLFAALLAVTAGCSSIAPVTPGDDGDATGATPSESAEADSTAYVFATDYASGGQLYVVGITGDDAGISNTGVELLGSSAVVRVYGGLIYVLHDGFSMTSSDNVQIIDPSDGYATLGQYSTGNGTNPHDIVVSGGRAFITLYNPAADPDNVDDQGRPGDVIEMDVATGEITNRYSFYDYLENDGDRNANADQMALAGDQLHVALQDLDSDTFAANSDGLIGTIDVTQNRVTGAIRIEGRNPVSLALSADGTKLAVANMASYDFGLGGFDTIRPYGGIETVDLGTRVPLGILDDEDLGGYVERVEAVGEDFYAVVSQFDGASFTYSSKLVSFPQNDVTLGSSETVDDSGKDIREIATSGGILWVSSRTINANTGLSDPRLEAFDLSTGERIGNALTPAVPGMSMVGF